MEALNPLFKDGRSTEEAHYLSADAGARAVAEKLRMLNIMDHRPIRRQRRRQAARDEQKLLKPLVVALWAITAAIFVLLCVRAGAHEDESF